MVVSAASVRSCSFLPALFSGHFPTPRTKPRVLFALPTSLFFTFPLIQTGQSVTVTVADVCPTCVGTDSIDLSEGAISALAGSTDYTQEGQYDVTWQWAA